MNTGAIAAEYRLSYWAWIIKERMESGLSVKAFCEVLGIHGNTYFYWQKRLREAACEEISDVKGVATHTHVWSENDEFTIENVKKLR